MKECKRPMENEHMQLTTKERTLWGKKAAMVEKVTWNNH